MTDKNLLRKLTERLQEILAKTERSETDHEEIQRLNHMIGVALQPVEGEKAELMQSAVEVAGDYAWKMAEHKELSDFLCFLASAAASYKAGGCTASEFRECAFKNLPEPKQSISVLESEGLWPWKGVN